MSQDKESLDKMIETCLTELQAVKHGKYESERAEKTAALFLEVQLRVADFLSDAEFKAKMSKAEVERVEADKYFNYKTSAGKVTEAHLVNSVSKDDDVLKAKAASYREEADFKKWLYVMNTLKDSHIYFRGMSKKQWE